MIGQIVGNYRVISKLGEGGMGVVYQAEHPVIGKRVALKVLHTEFGSNAEVVSRFFNEARAVNLIGHPGIVDVIDLGHTPEGAPYFTMEMLDGESLGARIARDGPMAIPAAVNISDQALDALAAAHGKGIVHRDIKPDNIFLVRRGGRIQVKVLDFGIAKMKDGAGAMHKTQTGSLMGTPTYMSPEQCRGAGTVDHRTDIYSFAVVLYEMLVGHPPFVGEGFVDLIRQHMLEAPRPMRGARPDLPPELEAAILRALAKEPGQRYPTAGEFRDGVLLGAGDAAPTSPVLQTLPQAAAATARSGGTLVGSPGAGVPAPASAPSPRGNTTYTGSTGEVSDLEADLAQVRGAGPGRKLAVGGVLLAAAAAGFLVLSGRLPLPGKDPSSAAGPSPSAPASSSAAGVMAPVSLAASVAGPAAAVRPGVPSPRSPSPSHAGAGAVGSTGVGAGAAAATAGRIHVTIETDPPRARVSVGGKRIGDTPLVLDLAPGEHRRIDITRPGMKPERRDILGDRDHVEKIPLVERRASATSSSSKSDFDTEGALAPSWMK